MTIAPSDVSSVVTRYFDAWNADASDRAVVVAEVFSEQAYYCDGAFEVEGRSAIAAMMEGVMDRFPAGRFTLASSVDHHHAQARFAWQLVGGDGATIMDGIDAVRFADDGRLDEVLGFFGIEAPSGDPTLTDHRFRWEQVHDVPAARLFALVSDLDVYADVAPNLDSIEVVDGDGVGTVRRCTSPEGHSWTETYSEWVPGERFTTVVDVATYPPDMQAMIEALEMTVIVEAVEEQRSRVVIEMDTTLTDVGLQVLRDGGAADELFQPILAGWAARLEDEPA